MISGVFFLDPSRELKISKLYKHNIFRIVKSFLFWSASYAFLNSLGKILVKDTALNKIFIISVLEKIILGHYHMWFLYTIVGLYLITPLLRKITADKKMTEYFIILSFIFCYLVNLLALVPNINTIIITVIGQANINFVLGYTGYFFIRILSAQQ